MPYVADLLQSGSRISFSLLAGPSDAAPLSTVTTVETLGGFQRAPAGSLAVVSARTWSRAAAYELDIAIRTAAERRLAALALIGGQGKVPVTAARLAGRAGLALLAVPEDCEVADVVLHLDQVIRGGAADALARAQAALALLPTFEGTAQDLLDAVGAALGRTLELVEEGGEPIWVAGRWQGGVSGPPDDAVRLVLPALAAALGRLRAAALERATAPGQTRSDVLTELVVAERVQAGQLADRARVLGLAVDEVHTVVWATIAGTASVDPAELAERRRLFDTISLHVHAAPHGSGEAWNVARLADDVVLAGTGRTEVREAAARQMITSIRGAVAEEHPGVRLCFGIGSAQRGIDGLRQSAMEARAAAAIAARSGDPIRAFDATGINRILAGIAGSPLSRRVVDDLLAPLDRLGPDRSAEAIRTLCVYLDSRGSLKAAAARLALHPNAVHYRIRKITERLGADLADPDTGFALHLACRVRLRD